jgi:hypothetical protein
LTEDRSAQPSLLERARGGDWDAIEDLVSGAVAPTFDAAFHLFGDPARAASATEEALLALLLAVRRGEITGGDPLRVTGRSLATAAAAAAVSPFASGLATEDLVAIGARPDDARGAAVGKLAAADRVAAILAFALDLEPADLAFALGRPKGEAAASVDRLLAALPHAAPSDGFREILDARASRARVPPDVEERVLDRYEKS